MVFPMCDIISVLSNELLDGQKHWEEAVLVSACLSAQGTQSSSVEVLCKVLAANEHGRIWHRGGHRVFVS